MIQGWLKGCTVLSLKKSDSSKTRWTRLKSNSRRKIESIQDWN